MASQNADKRAIPLIVSLAIFMEALDTTILNTALPAMSNSLQINPIDLKIALISYLLSLAVFIPISGWVGDKFGIKRIFISALVLFTASSLVCGFANNLTELIVARILQGLGGALTIPIGRLLIIRNFARTTLLTTMNKMAMLAAFGTMLGPVLGGLITHYFSWRWIFWVNIPIGLLAITLASCYLITTTSEKVPPLDKAGFILFGSSLAAFTFGLSAFSQSAISSVWSATILFTAILLFLSYIWHSHRQPHPIIKIQLLRLRTFKISVTGNLLARLGFGGMPFLLPLLLQIGLGYSAQIAGLLLVPNALGTLLVKPITIPLLRLLGYKRLLVLNTALVGLSLASFALINSHTSLYIISAFSFAFGFVTSTQYSAMNSLAYAEISTENFSAVTSIMSTLQQLAQSFGVAVSALFIRHFSHDLLSANALTPSVFAYTFLAMGIITVLSNFIFMRLQTTDGQQMIHSDP